jgi:glucose/mannose-6-phosphate isomerase
LELTSLQKYDTQGMYKVYEKWPEIAQQYFENNSQNVDFGNISHVVFAGMGGSGAIGDIFSSILSKTDIHVEVIKGYLLPKTVNKNSLVVATSISGNTEETLAILRKAYELKCKIVAFSDGGKMQQYCIKNQINHKQISMNHSPRASFPAFLYSILNVLQPFLPIEKNDIQDSLNSLKKQREQITSNNLTLTNPALELAKWINDIPLIYYPWGLQAAAIRFKNSLQENAKMHAITEDVIEACHNGIVSWEKNSQIKPILIQGNDDYIKTKERWKILREFFEDRKIEYKEIKSVDGGIFSKLINLIYLLDYSTIYRASLSKIDPTPVKSIDFVKKRLS